jgi:hypothetical protein
VCIPDFVVIGGGRTVVIEVDGPHHFGATRVSTACTRGTRRKLRDQNQPRNEQ